MKYLKYLFLFILLFPLTVFAEDSITISNLTLVNKEGLAVELNPATINGTTISLDTKMYEIGDSIEYQFTIENNTNNEYGIDAGNLNSEYVNYQLRSDNGNILKPSSTNTYTLTATYENEVPQDSFKGGKFEVGVDQLLELKDSSLINPLTGNFFYILLLFIISISLIFVLKLKYRKTIITLLFIGLFIIPYYTHATEIIHLDFGLKIGNILPTYCTYDGEVEYGTEYVNGQFTYYYGKEYTLDTYDWEELWQDIGDGWSVQLTDKESTDPVTTSLCTYINDKPIISSTMMFSYSNTSEIDMSSYNTSHIIYMDGMFYYPLGSLTTLDVSNLDTSNVVSMSAMFSCCDALTSLDLSGLDTSNVIVMDSMFESCYSLTSLDVSGFNTSNVTNMSYMFDCCYALTNLDLSNFDTSNVVDVSYMFCYCKSLTSIDVSNFDTLKAENIRWMFFCCYALTSIDLSNFDTSNVTRLDCMFSGCKSLTSIDLSNFNTSNVVDVSKMFSECELLTYLDLSSFDTSHVTDMSSMFRGCISLPSIDLSNFDTSNVTRLDCMFYGCQSLTSLDVSSFDNSNVEDMSDMFYQCESLTSLELGSFDTSNATDMSFMFYVCSSLVTIDLSGFNMSNVSDIRSMFSGCTSLTTVYARTQDDIDILSASSNLPSGVQFELKSV